MQNDIRKWIRVVKETIIPDKDDWTFWAQAKPPHRMVNCGLNSHTVTAIDDMGITGTIPDDLDEWDRSSYDDQAIIRATIDAGWVRGSFQTHGTAGVLFLHGQPRDVLAIARLLYDSDKLSITQIIIDLVGAGSQQLSDEAMMRWLRTGRVRMSEAVIVRDRGASDVDGKLRHLTIHLNPSHAEALALITRAVEHSVRGFVRESDGFVVIWDAYLTDHTNADQLLSSHGYGNWWPRFAIEGLPDFTAGIVSNYVERDEEHSADQGMSQSDWAKIPLTHLTRMLGKPPQYNPQ